jgi:hypothetical protein
MTIPQNASAAKIIYAPIPIPATPVMIGYLMIAMIRRTAATTRKKSESISCSFMDSTPERTKQVQAKCP